MRLSLVEDYDENGEDDAAASLDSISHISQDIAANQQKQSASYTNLFDTSQPMPVGATYQRGRLSPQVTRKDAQQERSQRPGYLAQQNTNRLNNPPLAIPEDFSPVKGSKPGPSVHSPGSRRHYQSKPPTGQTRHIYHDKEPRSGQGASSSYNDKNNGHPVRSASEERFRDGEVKASGNPAAAYSRYPDKRVHRSQDYLDQRGQAYNRPQGNKVPVSQGRHTSDSVNNYRRYDAADTDSAADYQRPMSFTKALEMSEVMLSARGKEFTVPPVKVPQNNSQQMSTEEKKKSVYDVNYEISV